MYKIILISSRKEKICSCFVFKVWVTIVRWPVQKARLQKGCETKIHPDKRRMKIFGESGGTRQLTGIEFFASFLFQDKNEVFVSFEKKKLKPPRNLLHLLHIQKAIIPLCHVK